MIAVRLMGGLGNQMFQYAAGRALALRHNTSLVLDASSYRRPELMETPRRYELGSFTHRGRVAPSWLDWYFSKMISPTDSGHLLRRFGYKLHIGFTYLTEETGGDLADAPSNSYLVGQWNFPHFFSEARPALLKDFGFKGTLPASSRPIFSEIRDNPHSVSIHVRRGDYATNATVRQVLQPLGLGYYRQAVATMTRRMTGVPRFYVFSDDIDWASKHLPLPQNSVFVSSNRRGIDDMRMMAACRHNIIANSSFSWWGAWLNQHPAKLVIAPKDWFVDPAMNSPKQFPADWLLL